MLTELQLPSFDTLIYNSRLNIARQVQNSHNSIIVQLCVILSFLNFCVCIYFLFTCLGACVRVRVCVCFMVRCVCVLCALSPEIKLI